MLPSAGGAYGCRAAGGGATRAARRRGRWIGGGAVGAICWQRLAVPALEALHALDPLSLHGASDDRRRRAPAVAPPADGVEHRAHIVAIDHQRPPAGGA